MDTPSPNEWLTVDVIAPALRRMVGDIVHISDQWTAQQLPGGRSDALGVWRIAGTMTRSSEEQQWSMVLKGFDTAGKSDSPSAFNWQLREADLYRSGVLNNLQSVFAPAYYGSFDHGQSTWVWLEDLTGVRQPDWALERYATAARLLGQFNGSYLSGRELPKQRSLSKRWLAGLVSANPDTMIVLEDYIHHPFVAAVLPPGVRSAYSHIWDRREDILNELDNMPQTFCHLDAYHRNSFFRETDGNEELVLIDWSFAGRGAIGEELVALCVAGGVFDPKMLGKLDQIESVAFPAYIEGLRDMGWSGEEERVWRAYRSAAILRFGPGTLQPLLPWLTSEKGRMEMADAFGLPIEQFQDHMARLFQWVADNAEDI